MKNNGITLVALVITIILLLILAGITISQLTGSGLFENARLAEEEYKNAQEKEDETLADYENKIGKYINNSRDDVSYSEFKNKLAEIITNAGIHTESTADADTIIANIESLLNADEIYIYHKGDEKQAITGGWEEKTKSHNDYFQTTAKTWFEGNGTYSSGTITKNDDNITFEASHPSSDGYGMTNVSVRTKNMIDLTNFECIYVDLDFSTTLNAAINIVLLNQNNEEIKTIEYRSVSTDLIEIDVSDVNQSAYIDIGIDSSSTAGISGSMTLRRVILE